MVRWSPERSGGDLHAYAALMARYRDKFGRYAFHMLGNREDAQEALQDSFVRAYRGLAACREPERFGAWLFRILVNRCRTVRTRLQRSRRFDADLPDDVPSNGERPDSFEWRDEIGQALEPAAPPLPRGVSAALHRGTRIRRDVGDDRREGAGASNAGQARERPASRDAARRPCRLTTTTESTTKFSSASWRSCAGRCGWTPRWTRARSTGSGRTPPAGRHRSSAIDGAPGSRARRSRPACCSRCCSSIRPSVAEPAPLANSTSAEIPVASSDVRPVYLRLDAPASSRVAVVGDFNDWDPTATPLRPTGTAGTWIVELRLKPGRYHYTFLIDGRRWERDPREPPVAESDFGAPVSVLTVI